MAPDDSSPAGSAGLRLETVAAPRALAGERVPIALRVTNVGDRTRELYLQGRTIVFDIVVTDADGRVVWRRLEGQTLQAILRIEVLAPGATLELSDAWTPTASRGRAVRPGSYTVRGVIPTDAAPLETPPVTVRLVER